MGSLDTEGAFFQEARKDAVAHLCYARRGNKLIKLSPREHEVLLLLMEKGRVRSVADSLNSSIFTVRSQKKSIMRKLGVTNTVDLVLSAIQKGLIKL